MPSAYKALIPRLELFTPRIDLISSQSKGKPIANRGTADEFPVDFFNHFPVVVDDNGVPWPPANLYLLSKLENINTPNPKTLDSIANDLVTFRRFLCEEEIQFDSFPKRKISRPTYRFRAYLVREIKKQRLRETTAKRKMSSVIGFYRWIQAQSKIKLAYPAWNESEQLISFKDEFGFSHFKSIRKTDISLTSGHSEAPDTIVDGGKLKPLDKEQQKLLAEALKRSGNIEMILIFLIALTSGARLQTICTLRLGSLKSIDDSLGFHLIRTGEGTLIDTKFNKCITLFIPLWLLERLKLYERSQRAIKRRKKSNHYISHKESQYLFLTKSGKPYYVSESDPQIENYRNPPKGDAIRQFIKNSLLKKIKQNEHQFTFRFHDIRATFGMNLAHQLLDSLEGGSISRLDILMIIKERMGHSRLETTEGYLNYQVKREVIAQSQERYEIFLRAVIDG